MQGIYAYLPETNYVPRDYSVAAILLLPLLLLLLLLYHFPNLCTLTACIFTGFKVLGSTSKGIRGDQWTIYVWMPLLVATSAKLFDEFSMEFLLWE
jgi:hypothetical protein